MRLLSLYLLKTLGELPGDYLLVNPEKMADIEDKYWLVKALEAEKEGFIGVEESEEWLKETMTMKCIKSSSTC